MDAADPARSEGVLVLAGTPLGNPADASARLATELSSADVIAAEDTRRLRRLAGELGVTVRGRVVSYFEGNERRRTPELVADLEAGQRIVLVTDAGMPSVSDPGYRLVDAALAAGIAVTAAPGPSAVVTALALSGLPVDRFSFEGFPPRKSGERGRFLSELARDPRTMVFFESRHRVAATLQAMADVFGADRPAAICRELTKTYEEVRRGTLAVLVAGVEHDPPLGEITLVVAGHEPGLGGAETTPEQAAAQVAELVQEGMDRKAAIGAVVAATGLRRRVIYDAVVQSRAQVED